MLSPRLKPFVFVVVMACVVAAAVAFVLTLRVHRFDSGFWDSWVRSFLIGAAVGVPVALLVAGPVRRFSDWVCK